MKDYTLREYAERHSLTYRTLWNKFKEGKLPNAYKDEFGHIKVKMDDDKIGDRTIVYVRVSSNDRKESLKEQQGKKIFVINKIFICSMKLSSFYIWFLLLMLV